jgi:hypothetical protein
LYTASLEAQEMKISGTVYDSSGVKPLKDAVIMAVRVKDSLLLNFTRSKENGSFNLTGFEPDTLSLIISHPNFDDRIFYIFGNKSNFEIDIPTARLNIKSKELAAITIYANKNPIYYKGDTLVYVADSFKVAENAVVEDLLKKLPGLKVDKNGKITSQGKEISKVLVDGDEFFGTDPTMATKNLAANGVESVQVYEKKNDNAKEGEDETIKVLDLKLKEEAKKGYFGKVSGASDFGLFEEKPFYEGELLLNKFNKTQKISVFALGSNTPKSNLGFGDMAKFGLNDELENSGMSMWDQNSRNTAGIPQTFKAGVYFNDKIGKRGEINVNYTYYNQQLTAKSNSKTQFFLTDSTYSSLDSIQNTSRSEAHKINLAYNLKIDSLTTLEIKPSLSYNLGYSDNRSNNSFIGETGILSLNTLVQNENDSKGLTSNSKITLNRKFKKPRRELELKYILETESNETTGKLSNRSTYVSSIDSIAQKKINNNSKYDHFSTVSYFEPLTKKIKLKFEYTYELGKTTQDKQTRDFYTGIVNTNFSNNFENTRIQNKVALEFIYDSRKHNFGVGLGARNITIENTNLLSTLTINQNINNLLPRAWYSYKPSQTGRLGINYYTSSAQPSINELQPIQDNTNPNRIQIGNADLKPNYTHSIRMNFNNWNAVSGRYIWSGLNATYINSAFANSSVFNNFGQTVSQTVNVDGNFYTNLFAGAGFPFFNRKLEIAPNINASYNRYTNLINGLENITQNTSIGGGLTIEFKPSDSLSISISPNFGYTSPKSSLNSVSNKPFSTNEYTASIEWTIPFNFKIKSDATYLMNNNLAAGYNVNIFIWNAEISRSFTKTRNLILSVQGNDILNQNKSIQREVDGNRITDNFTKLISRYFLLKVTYKFNNNKTKEDDFQGWH